MNKSEYLELLKDPRWQRKRLEILERDSWTCQVCKSKDMTLHVHHCWYEDGVEPWDYPDGCFVTLCEVCHEREPKGVNFTWIQKRLSRIEKVAIDVSALVKLSDLFLKAKSSEGMALIQEIADSLRRPGPRKAA